LALEFVLTFGIWLIIIVVKPLRRSRSGEILIGPLQAISLFCGPQI